MVSEPLPSQAAPAAPAAVLPAHDGLEDHSDTASSADTTTPAVSAPPTEASVAAVDVAQPPPSPPSPVTLWSVPDLDVDREDDADSAMGEDNAVSTISLSASIMEYRILHGRTYHSLRSNAEYWAPNDAKQNESLDIVHHVYLLLLNNRLFLAPIGDNVQKVLDVGTGTGIWAIDFADQFPNANVIGTDLSPIQPSWLPPNLKFEIDDATQDWTFSPASFDFIHLRVLGGSIRDWRHLMAQAYKCCRPGGWIESVEASFDARSDDGSVVPGMALHDWGRLFSAAGRRSGRSFDVVEQRTNVTAMRAAGFVDIQEHRFKVPIGDYSEDERMALIGRFNHMALEEGLEGYALHILCNIFHWSIEQVHVYLSHVRKELRSKKVHPYYELLIVYGRRPSA